MGVKELFVKLVKLVSAVIWGVALILWALWMWLKLLLRKLVKR